MDEFQQVAESVVAYKIRTVWFEIVKLHNEMAKEHVGTLSMAFILVAINEEEGTPVTKIAPRMGMEPNSLSRSLKSLEQQGCIYKKKHAVDKRKVTICLTEYGMELRNIALKTVFSLNKAIMKDIPSAKLSAFFDVMNSIPETLRNFKKRMRENSLS